LLILSLKKGIGAWTLVRLMAAASEALPRFFIFFDINRHLSYQSLDHLRCEVYGLLFIRSPIES
jgi:hypothetical protein